MEKTGLIIFLMIVAAIPGYFLGAYLHDGFGGAVLFSLIAGMAGIVHVIDNKDKH